MMLMPFLVAVLAVTGDAPRGRAQQDASDPRRAVLESLGEYPGAVLIREYLDGDGYLCRRYAVTERPLAEAAESVTAFYRQKLLAPDWEQLQLHAATEVYRLGNLVVALTRSGPEDVAPPTGVRLIRSAPVPAGATFFFSIDAKVQRQIRPGAAVELTRCL